jgi:hypothetical protein
MYGERRGTYRVLVRKPEGMRPLGRPRCGWEDNINVDLQEIEWEGAWMNLSGSGYGQVADFCTSINER